MFLSFCMQLQCDGRGSAGCANNLLPYSVQCKNNGINGVNVQVVKTRIIRFTCF